MKLTKKEEKEIWQVYNTWLDAYLNGDVKTYDKYLDKDYHFIGSTNNEEFLNKKDTTAFFKATGEQFAGMTDLRKETKTLEIFGEHVFITHFFDAWFKNQEDWSFYGRFRFSSVIHKTKEGWRFIYQHFSMPDSKSEEGQTIGFDKVHLENQELREAILRRTTELEQKNRELEIEGALARIRAQAVAMKASSDLLDIVVTMRIEFIKLGHEAHYFWHMMWLPKTYEKAMTSGDGSKIGFVMTLPKHMHGDIPLLAKWEKSKKSTIVYAMNTKEAIDYVDKMVALGDFKNIDPQAPTHDDIKHIGGLTFIMARTSHGEIGYSLPGMEKNPPKEDVDILVQFAAAFDLAHRRFLDLQKAERQAREVQIELALEKVRSRTMAMQHSDELQETSFLLDEQVRELGINTWGCAFNIYGENESTEWFGNEAGVLPTYTVPHKGIFKKYYQKGLKGESLFIQEFSGKACVDHYEYMSSLPVIGDVLKNLKKTNKGFPTYQIDHVTYFKYGYLLFITKEQVPDAHDVFKRFAKVFEQTYTRFLDLQKAEAQAREAQIETALERVRSCTMAMHKSEELADVAQVLFEQISLLTESLDRFNIIMPVKDSDSVEAWVTDQKGHKVSTQFILSSKKSPVIRDFNKAWKEKKPILNIHLKGKRLQNWLTYINEVIGIPLKNEKKLKNRHITLVNFTHGYIGTTTHSAINEETVQLIQRFAKVFEQTYTRFLDLQKAEAQARESQIEASLERVRASAMAMHKSDDLTNSVDTVFSELKQLGFNTVRCGIGIFNDQSNNVNVWTISSDSKEEKARLSGDEKLEGHPLLDGIYKAWTNQVDFSYTLKGKDLENYYQIVSDSNLPVSGPNNNKLATQYYHVVNFPAGGLFTFSDTEFTLDKKLLMKRFGEVFHLSFTRHLDLKQAEAQAREAQIEMALEKVRSRTMAMQNSSELPDAANNLFLQVQELGIPAWSAGYCLWEDNQKSTSCNMSSEGEIQKSFSLPTIGEGYNFHKPLKNGEPFHVAELGGKKLVKHYDFMKTLPGIGEVLEDFAEKGISLPTFQIFHIVYFTHGYLMFITYEAVPNDWDVFKRFGKVFQQTFTRFLDLQKAEAQAREAQIEVAMERIRSRSLAMHTSKELMDVITELRRQIDDLGQLDLEASVIHLYTEGATMFESIAAVRPPGESGEIVLANVFFPVDATHQIKHMMKMYSSDATEYTIEFKKEMAEEWQKTMMKYAPEIAERRKGFVKNRRISEHSEFWNFADFSSGSILLVTHSEASEDTKEVLRKAAQVFDLAYRRFKDLQKAEAQVREAQIEAALEKVRSRTMAMQKGEEVKDVVVLLYKELITLGVTNFATCGYVEINEETKRQETWVTNPGGDSLGLFYLPLTGDVHFDARYKAWKKQQTVFHQTVAGKERKKHLEYAITTFNSKEAEEMVLTQFPDPTVFYCFNFSHGYLHLVCSSQLTKEEETLLARFTRVFEQTYARFLDLEKAEAQTRTAQINLAVERVRAKALAMHKSEEIMQVVAKLKDEVMSLDIPDVVAATIFLNEGDDKVRMWDLSSLEKDEQGYEIPFDITFKLKKKDPHLYVKRIWENPGNYFVEIQVEKDFKRIISFLRENNKVQIADEVEEFTEATKLKQLFHATKSLNNGKLVIDLLNEPTAEMETILTKMGAAFDLAYKRFEDLQKAELQAREAQIEAALEKVRSRSLAMHKPNELQEVVAIVAEKLQELGVIYDAGGVILCTYFPDNKDVVHWIAVDDFSTSGRYFVPYFDNPIFSEAWDSKMRGDAYFSKEFPVEVKNHFFEQAFEHSDYKHMPKDYKEFVLQADKHHLSAAWSKNSAIIIPSLTGAIPSESDAEIIKRFAKVFEQAYIRFMDLEKAEAQAKEAQIEAALERVRSKSMAMHKSEELLDVISVVSEQLIALEFRFHHVSFANNNIDETYSFWTSAKGKTQPMRFVVPYIDIVMFRNIIAAQKKSSSFFSDILTQKEHRVWHKHLLKNDEQANVFSKEENEYIMSKGMARSIAINPNIMLIVANYASIPYTEEENKIIKRFGQVFEQSYTRFLDLLKAEAQARESLIEASLERVRSRTLAMQNSEELAQTSVVVFQQLLELGIAPNRLFIGIVKDEGNKIEAWVTNEDGSKLASQFTLQASKNKSIKKMLGGWKQQKKSLVINMKGKELQDYFQYLNKEMDIPFIHGLKQKKRVQTIAYFSGGLIGMAAPEEQPQETINLLERFAAVFNLTYTRFKDLKVAEAQAQKAEEDLIKLQLAKKRAEEALSELQLTQTQLIQSEKMASLGELTAGIAHEIQNPLNFVNNFSEVSKELLDEMIEELENGDMEEVKAITDDVIQNLEKINHHGKRADGIVKGMLQHSRASGDKKEPTDINALADEYLRLAYHGLRAKDKSFNATLLKDFDDSIGNINIIPQDLGRVVLNLLTNAFYVVNEKKLNNHNEYNPTVSLTTKKYSNWVTISVKDNGNGIPKKVLDKIFQPFFTTKPTGQGTGLGLSMSYDIVTKGHGGELKVETKQGKGTEFKIILPV